VLKEFPGKTHLEFDALSSVATQIALEKRPSAKVVTTNLLDYYTSYNFVKLNHSNDKKVVESTLERISKENYRNLNLETRDASYEFELQALAEITPGYILSNSMGNGLPVPMLWFLTVLCLIVIFSACFNYTNLTIARSFSRFREVGVRKVMGATRSQIFAQFISEALVVALFSLGLGFLFLELLIPAFNRIQTFSQMDITLNIDEVTILLFLTFTIAVGVLAGILPALFLSRFSPLHIIQKLENVKLFRRIGLRKTFIVAQFAISLIFILVMTIAWKQVNFSFANSFGSDRTDIMNLRVPENSYSKLSTSFNNVPGVNKVSGISHLMGTWEDDKIDIKVSPGGDPIEVRDYVIDHHYIDNFNIELIAGENFVENLSQQKETFAIVNEKFLELFDLGTPIEAMGKPIFINGNEQLKVHGVVKDFLYKPMVYQLEPLLLRYNPEEWNVINLSMSSNQLPGTIAAIEKIWGEIVEGTEFQYAFYDETIEDTYTDFRDMTRVVGSFGILGIIIACLGLLGMAMYSIETRTREIGIRKIIGAGEMDLIRLLSKGFLMMIVIAIFLAVPISYIAGKFLLQFFASTIPLNFGVFFPGVFMLMLLGAIIIGSQTVRAVFANPVESIKSE
jgi:putative ABC transport system permease protein